MENQKFSILITASPKDKRLVEFLTIGLSKQNFNINVEENILVSSNRFPSELLLKGLDGNDAIIILITQDSYQSQWINTELKIINDNIQSKDRSKLILPIVYGNVKIPEIIKNRRIISWPEENYQEVIDKITNVVNKFIDSRAQSNTSKNKTKQSKKESASVRQGKIETKEESRNEVITPNYWLFKMNPETWNFEQLKVGEKVYFHTNVTEKKLEYDLLLSVKYGDKVLIYAIDEYQSIVCIMEVTAPARQDKEYGERIEMVIERFIKPGIPFRIIKDLIEPDQAKKLTESKIPTQFFFPLSPLQYQNILAAESAQISEDRKVYQPFYVTEGNHKETEDQLDFENDIDSFANVIALKKVNPPLAIGLFGNWGSGKSFFMEKLSERIEDICESKEPEYIQNVVQVKFNSWHYSDANLWASLINQIFENLHDFATKKAYGAEAIKAIYTKLHITNHQIEETQKKIAANEIQESALQVRKDNVEKTLKQKIELLSNWTSKDFLKIVLSDPYIQNDIESIKEQFQFEELKDNIDQIDEKLSEINTIGKQIAESFKLLKKNSGGKWIWIWVIALLFAIGIFLVLGPLKEYIELILTRGFAATGLFLTGIATVTTKLSPYFSKINQFYKRLKSLKKTIDSEKERVKFKEHDEIIRLNKEIDDLISKKTALELEQTQVTNNKARLENEINEIGSGRLLANFLADKSADDAYIKQLGTISWVRKDFAKLNELFQKQKSVQDVESGLSAEVQIDRIVLYIDDLDRCNEDVVVKVLEAIHLLLAFPLFVVVVGVDPRWLNNALSEKYKNLFGHIGKNNDTREENQALTVNDKSVLLGAASSYDYLEKIFQIPFALKPIDKTGRESLIQYLVREEMAENNINKTKGAVAAVDEKSNPEDIVPNNENDLPASKKDDSTVITPEDEKIATLTKKTKERLIFTSDELACMQRFSVLYGHSPRAINRFINIYRIIKAHGNLNVAGSYSEDEYMPILFLLGIIVGCSAYAEKFLIEISNADDDKTFDLFMESQNIPIELKAMINPISSDLESLTMKDFKRNLNLISRFSFRTLIK